MTDTIQPQSCGHDWQSQVTRLWFSPDGTWLASLTHKRYGLGSSSVIIWNAASAEFTDEYEFVRSYDEFAWSPDSKCIAVVGELDFRVHILTIVRIGATHRLHLQGTVEYRRYEKQGHGSLCFGWTTNGAYFLTLDWNSQTLCRWKTDTLTLDKAITSDLINPPLPWEADDFARLRTTIQNGWMVNRLARGQYMPGVVQIWDVERWRLFVPQPYETQDDQMQDAVMCSDRIIVLCQRSLVRIDLSTGSSTKMPFFDSTGMNKTPRLSPMGRYALFQDQERILIRETSTGRTQFSIRVQQGHPVDWWAFSEDDTHVAWSNDKSLTVYNLLMKKYLVRRECVREGIVSGAFSSRNDVLVLGQTNGAVLFRPL